MAYPSSPESGPFLVSAGLITDRGCVRDLNEDCCQVVHPSDPDVLDQKGVLIVVADGMGGCQAGEVASRIAVETVARAYYASAGEPQAALAAAFHEHRAGHSGPRGPLRPCRRQPAVPGSIQFDLPDD